MTSQEQLLEILQKAYQIEVDGYTFYSMTAERAQKEVVKELFEKLADDEVKHQAFLKSVMKGYKDKGLTAFQTGSASDWSAFSQKVFTDRFREQAKGASFEMGVLSVGMTLETNAVAYFTGASKAAQEKEIREFYGFLADWEKTHFDALKNLFEGVRADFWGDSGFAAF